ncbi:GNAT family N-acetyltransferase [Cryobacterium glucosi]|uniref:GNAT family N-acetyltransferase n=1 Tax=Cryobacterium glucosi TaxID=1259175 RepID=A0ABY2INI6_9MICO|nr:GNAT family N-acetyltransferase [Cryobacterium glucosi]TFC19471.1 GNAT family N-acetyltransferase [Cryobacterium glucosi]
MTELALPSATEFVQGPVIRRAGLDDVSAIAVFQTDCWREAYVDLVPAEYLQRVDPAARAIRWKQRIALALRAVWVAHDGPVLRGVVSSAGDSEPLELASLYVDSASRGTGLSQLLLETAVGESSAFLWVFEDNARAHRFYTKFGFEPDGAREIDPDTGIGQIRLARPSWRLREVADDDS